jgi:hypothetical protein
MKPTKRLKNLDLKGVFEGALPLELPVRTCQSLTRQLKKGDVIVAELSLKVFEKGARVKNFFQEVVPSN